MDTIRLPGIDHDTVFAGRLLASASTETPTSPRWIELDLYEIEDGPRTGQFVLHRVGCSVIYHRADSECNTGSPMRLGDLDEDAEPCPTCRPPLPGSADENTTIQREDDMVTTRVCADGQEVVSHLRFPSGGYSKPAQRLLTLAKAASPVLAQQLRAVHQL